jgi:hypothetical protein
MRYVGFRWPSSLVVVAAVPMGYWLCSPV